MHKVYENFEESEEALRAAAPATVYKYRTWKDEYHKDLINKKVVWFSHPFDLNDPLDVRPETVFNPLELEDPRFFAKLMASAQQANPHLNTPEELRIAAEEQWRYLKANPEVILENWNNHNLVRENFDQYGVFSASKSPLSEGLWEKYADNHSGFCLGFDTVELCRIIKSGYGDVNYSNDPLQYTFFEDAENRDLDRLYLKKTTWDYEDEYRFITVGVGVYCERPQSFGKEAVKELILGCNSKGHEDEIINAFNAHFNGLPIYRTLRDNNGKLTKVLIP